MERARTKILGTIGLLLIAAFVFGIAFALMPSSSNVAEARESYFAVEGDDWEPNTFTELNYGLYWYTADSPIPKKSNPVDKNKPTLIFAHGWKENEGFKQRDLLSVWENTDSQFASNGFASFASELNETEYYKTLIEQGYNVAHFYWCQISDDAVTCDEKIWSSNGALGMSYVLNDGHGKKVQGDPALNPTKSVAMILGDAIKDALGTDYQRDLHLVGHSMGGQLVLAAGEYLARQYDKGLVGKHLVPSQVTLIDPYMTFNVLSSNSTIDHLDGKAHSADEQVFIVDLCADAMETLARHNVAIDSYGTVFYRMYPFVMDEEKANEVTDRLARYCVWTYLKGLTSKYTLANGHCMAIDYYFSTLYENTIAKDNYGREVPSARATKEYLLNLRGKAFVQTLSEDKAGQNPFYMHNSTYTRTNAEYEAVSDDYTAYVEPPVINPPAEEKNDILHNKDFIIGISVGAGTLAIVIAVVVIYFVTKKKLKQ